MEAVALAVRAKRAATKSGMSRPLVRLWNPPK